MRMFLYSSALVMLIAVCPSSQAGEGYDDTPFLPGGKWRVHDKSRPTPAVVTPGEFSTQDKQGQAPSDAIVLFDGKDLAKWSGSEQIKENGKVVGSKECEARWKIENGYMEVNKTGDIKTKEPFGSCQLHVEWASPAEVKGKSQGSGNSGVFLMGLYEIQILNSYENETYADGQAASLYGYKPPDVNVTRKPGEWQTYDIIFDAPVFKDGKLEKPAYVTVIHNGVLVHNHIELLGASGHKNVGKYSPHAEKLPLKLQDHNNPVRYRNIWVRPLA